MLFDKKRDECEGYLRKHKIKELFEDLCTAISYKRPENVEEFLIKEIELRKEKN